MIYKRSFLTLIFSEGDLHRTYVEFISSLKGIIWSLSEPTGNLQTNLKNLWVVIQHLQGIDW